MRRTLPLTARRAFLMGAMGTALLTVLRTSASERKLAPFSLLDVEASGSTSASGSDGTS